MYLSSAITTLKIFSFSQLNSQLFHSHLVRERRSDVNYISKNVTALAQRLLTPSQALLFYQKTPTQQHRHHQHSSKSIGWCDLLVSFPLICIVCVCLRFCYNLLEKIPIQYSSKWLGLGCDIIMVRVSQESFAYVTNFSCLEIKYWDLYFVLNPKLPLSFYICIISCLNKVSKTTCM